MQFFSSDFRGRIVQVTDALDRYDAVSNQVCALDSILVAQGFRTIIASQWAHPDRETLRTRRSELNLTEDDVLIVHYYGFSDGLAAWLDGIHCTKVMIYHNITPHSFFTHNPKARHFCEAGRQQLKEILPAFHFHWGDSTYNVEELVELGADPARTAVIPIVVSEPEQAKQRRGTPGNWVFVGRMAPNKGIVDLVKMFAQVHADRPQVARQLVLIGGHDPSDGYSDQITAAIERSGCKDRIHLKGKLSDEERDHLLSEADVYVSLSEHEGFGVPLVEAPLSGIPVIALDRAAVNETLGQIGVFPDLDGVAKAIGELTEDRTAYADLLEAQQRHSRRFADSAVSRLLHEALGKIIPRKQQFQTVSVVICTYNRRDYLERCLDYLSFQSNGNFEVIVVNGPSNDGTRELLELHKGRVKVVNNPERNLSKSRNLGIDASSGDIVAFIDDDAIPFDDWIEQILSEYNQRPLTVGGLGGPAYYAGTFWFQAEDNGISADCQVKVNIDSTEIGRNGWHRYNTGTNATFTYDALRDADGFDEQFDYFLDEAELCFRLQRNGYLIGYSPEILVRHEFAQSHNRGGKLNYNWFTICKNTAYYIATNSGLKSQELETFVTRRITDERVKPLDEALRNGALSQEARDKHVAAIWDGVKQGMEDAAAWPRTRPIVPRQSDFKRFDTRMDRIAVLRDVPQLHICIVSKEAPPFAGSGGVGTLYYHLASELLLMGHRVSFVVPSGEDSIHRQGRLSVYFTKLQTFPQPETDGGFAGNIDWSLSALAKLASIHREHRIDVVDSALWDTETLSFSLLERSRRPPLVVRLVTPFAVTAKINDWNPSEKQLGFFMEAERSLIRNADAVIPISDKIASTISREYGLTRDERWSMGHCGIAYWPTFDVNEGYGEFPELGALNAGEMASAKLVVFIGRLERRKGIDIILDAATDILASAPDAVIVLAGRDQEDWASRFRDKLPPALHRRLVPLGEISDVLREKLLAHAYCVLFPSRYESFGLVPLEAFVHGTPVIACAAGAIPEVVEEGRSGLLVAPDGSAALAAATVRLLNDAALREYLSNGARRRVKHLSARNSALHTLEVYARVLRNRKSGVQ